MLGKLQGPGEMSSIDVALSFAHVGCCSLTLCVVQDSALLAAALMPESLAHV